jgi:hypothetical protein
LDQSVARQLTGSAPSLGFGHVKAFDFGANLIAIGESTQEEVEIEARHWTYNQQEKEDSAHP